MVAVTSGRHDPGICVALGNILEEEDENEAFKMYNDVSTVKLISTSLNVNERSESTYICRDDFSHSFRVTCFRVIFEEVWFHMYF